MGMKKIRRLIGQEVSKAYENGWNKGWDVGWTSAMENVEEAGGLFDNGVKAERERIIALFNMLSNSEFETGSPSKARAWKDAAELVKIADELEAYDEDGEYLG